MTTIKATRKDCQNGSLFGSGWVFGVCGFQPYILKYLGKVRPHSVKGTVTRPARYDFGRDAQAQRVDNESAPGDWVVSSCHFGFISSMRRAPEKCFRCISISMRQICPIARKWTLSVSRNSF